MRKSLQAATLAVAFAGASLTGIPAASAQTAVDESTGLVNVSDVGVQVPLNVCGNQVNVIAVPVLNSQTAECEASAGAQQGAIAVGEDGHDHKKKDEKKDHKKKDGYDH